MKKKRSHERNAKKIKLMLGVTLIILLFIFFMYELDMKIQPALEKAASLELTTRINSCLSRSVKLYQTSNKITSDDFYIRSLDGNGRIYSLGVNTVLINDICAGLAEDISTELTALSEADVTFKLGTLTGVSFLSDMGPLYSVRVQPMGTSVVDYESSFSAAGINQVNFQIWLNIKADVELVRPLASKSVQVTRKIMLVNTVFAGEVPNSYFQVPVK